MTKKCSAAKKSAYMIVFAILLLTLFSSQTAIAASNDIVTIPDPKLKDALLRAGIDGNNDGNLTEGEMATLIELDAPISYGTTGINSLTGLEYASNLLRLNIPGGGIYDLTPIQTLTFMSELRLQNHDIIDLSPLQNMVTLELLLLDGNEDLFDLSPLSGMSRLESLYVGYTSLSDLTYLNVLTDLKTLRINNTYVTTNLSALSALANLELLGINDNNINDLTGVEQFPNLIQIGATNCKLSTLAPLSSLSHLSVINCENNFLDVTPGSADMTRINNWIGSGVTVTYLPQKTGGALTGTVTINGTLKFGEQLTAVVSVDNSITKNFTYRWYRGSTLIPGVSGNQYTLVQEDIGTQIKVEAFSDDRTGSIESAPTATVGKANQTAPNDLTVGDLTIDNHSITVTIPNPTYEYLLKDNGVSLAIGDIFTPGTGVVRFDSLTGNTDYDLYYRKMGTATHHTSSYTKLDCQTQETGASGPTYVSQDGTCGGKNPCFLSIQSAVNNAVDGSGIMIAQGTYIESISLNTSKSLTIQGGWDSSFATQTPNTTFIKAPTVPQGSLTLLMLTVKP